jgi:hypothetical protein
MLQTDAGDALQTAGNHMRETRETVRETYPHTPIGTWQALEGCLPVPLTFLPAALCEEGERPGCLRVERGQSEKYSDFRQYVNSCNHRCNK